MTRIIAIDPGVMTGFVYARITNDKQLEAFPFQAVDEVDDLWRRLFHFAPDIIIMEDFEVRGKGTMGLNLFPVQLIGIVHLYEMIEPKGTVQVFMQKASQGKSYYSDHMLKANKVYKRGCPHGMDALRHLLHWTTFGAGFQLVNPRTGDATAMLLKEWEGQDEKP